MGVEPVPNVYVDVALVPSRILMIPASSSGVGGRLRHLPLSIQLTAVNSKPDDADQQQAHCNQDEEDGLPVPRTQAFGGVSQGGVSQGGVSQCGSLQNRITPCAALPSRIDAGKYVISGL